MPSQPNVIVVVTDTVRRDRVSCYGHERPTTPALDAFAERATRFGDPISQAPWSIPAHASLLTGAVPADHGATTVRPVLRCEETLPALLKTAGYETYAVSANEYVRPMTGFGRGFDEFYTPGRVTAPDPLVRALGPVVNTVTSTAALRRPVERAFNKFLTTDDPSTVTGTEGATDDGTVDRVLDIVDRAHEPYFLYAPLMDAHLPRSPAREPFEQFVDPDLREVELTATERAHVFSEDRRLEECERRKLRQLYDADLRTMDDRLGRLLSGLEARGALDDSLVVLVSDHGEHLGEFDLIGHQHSVFDSVVSVPLVVKVPGQDEGRTVPGQFETRRVFHTILDEAGVRAYPDRTLANGSPDETATGAFYTPMIDIGRLVWDRTVEYDRRLLGERLSFARADGHKLVRQATDEWLLTTPESPGARLSPDEHADIYARLAGE